MNSLIHFFKEEQIQGYITVALGLIAIIIALIFMFIIKYSFFKGMAISLVCTGLLEIACGINKIQITEGKLSSVSNNNNYYNEHEIVKQINELNILIIICIILIFISFGLYFYFNKTKQDFWKGFTLCIMLQAFIFFIGTSVSKSRINNYELQQVNHQSITKK